MSKEQFVYSSKNTFSAGELTPTIEGRNDLPLYQHGVKKLINFMILPSGGIIRRHGTQYASMLTKIKGNSIEKPVTRVMLSMMYSRKLSFLVIFNKISEKKIRVDVLINGGGETISLGEFPISLNRKSFCYSAHQGVVYISFGVNYPIYSFSIDPSQVNKLAKLDKLSKKQRRELFIFEILKIKGNIYPQDTNYNKIRKDNDKDSLNKSLASANKSSIALKQFHAISINVFVGRLWAFGAGNPMQKININTHSIWTSALSSMDEFNLAYKSLLEARSPLSAFSANFTSNSFDNVIWSIAFGREMLLATGDGIYVLKPGDRTKDEFIHINKEIDISVSKIKPVLCGKTIFFVEGDNKQIHSLYYSDKKSGYQTSCVSTYAEHLFTSGIKQIVAVNSPFNIVFAIMNNGSFASFTYSQDLKIMGWSQHWLGGDGKVLEAVILSTNDSQRLYFRVLRQGYEYKKDGKLAQINREYLEFFDCKYLSASLQNQIHTPLYADCHTHYKQPEEDKIDQMFAEALKQSDAFEFKDDISKLEQLIVKQIELQSIFNIKDIENNFGVGSTRIKDLPNTTLNNQTIHVKKEYVTFINNYFKNYIKIVQTSIALEMAIFRKLKLFHSHIINIILGKIEEIEYLDIIKQEAANILKQIKANYLIIASWQIHEIIEERQFQLVYHLENPKYSFFPIVIFHLRKNDRLTVFERVVDELKILHISAEYYIRSPEIFVKIRNQLLHQSNVIKTNHHWLNFNLNHNVENLDLLEFLAKSTKASSKQKSDLKLFNQELIDLGVRSQILAENPILDSFIKYFNITLDQLADNDGILDQSATKISKFFATELVKIRAIISNSFGKKALTTKAFKDETITLFDNLLNLLGVVPIDVKKQINLSEIIESELEVEEQVLDEIEDDLISKIDLMLCGFLVELGDTDDIKESIKSSKEFILEEQSKYTELENIDNLYLIYATYLILSTKKRLDEVMQALGRTANFAAPSEEDNILMLRQDHNNPSRIDKGLLLCKDNFPIFRQLFPDIDLNMIKIITRNINASIDMVEGKWIHQIYGGMKIGFIGDDELIKNERISLFNLGRINLNRYVRFLSLGFVYKSVLQTFPLIFPDEIEHMEKKDTSIGIKFFNSKGGYIEETEGNGKTYRQFIKSRKLDTDDINLYLPDKKYLIAESISSITTPYVSGWVSFACNRPLEKDIDLIYVVDKPYPVSILKIYAKAKIFPHCIR